MLEYFFKMPKRLEQFRRKPLSEHIDGLAENLRQVGFTRGAGQRILRMVGKFNRFALSAGVENPERIDAKLVERFTRMVTSQGTFSEASSAMRHLLEFLRDEGVLPMPAASHPADPFKSILSRYDNHLRSVRGLSLSSCSQYLRYARQLLSWLQNRHGDRPLAELSGVDLLEFVTDLAELHHSVSWRQNLCSLTRVFLRYLKWEGILEGDLDRLVPKLPSRRLGTLPRHLPWEQVQELIDSVDTNDAVGLRDKAVLLLIATLALRNKEVRHLQLSEIAWRAGEIRLTQTKTRRERILPLPKELGEALAEYVLHGRPRLPLVNQVFLRHRAPQGPITSTHGISDIVRKHLLRVGIDAPSYGAHLLRHSLATRMVNQGVSIKLIADVLGHASIDTTAIYTKVDRTNLAAVALPFPGGEA